MLADGCPFTETNSSDFRRTAAPGSWIRLADRQSGLPEATQLIFARAFAVDPAERPSGALACLDDLEHVLNR
jgi:hypothetical protein